MPRIHRRHRRKPHFDESTRLLSVGDIVVKEFRVPAQNQELILAAFEELGWPPYIDDPLPQDANVVAKQRLHDAINRLNRNQQRRLLHFHGNGKGTGIGWTYIRRGGGDDCHQIATRMTLDEPSRVDCNPALVNATWGDVTGGNQCHPSFDRCWRLRSPEPRWLLA